MDTCAHVKSYHGDVDYGHRGKGHHGGLGGHDLQQNAFMQASS
jgi:hypothetical protein